VNVTTTAGQLLNEVHLVAVLGGVVVMYG